jgi:hypothetical protein
VAHRRGHRAVQGIAGEEVHDRGAATVPAFLWQHPAPWGRDSSRWASRSLTLQAAGCHHCAHQARVPLHRTGCLTLPAYLPAQHAIFDSRLDVETCRRLCAKQLSRSSRAP